MADVTIYTSRNCGWALRNYAALIEKGISFNTVPAKDDAGTKLDAFLSLTPYGKTPVLSYEGTTVFESCLINEFIDEQFPDPPLLPDDPGSRSNSRNWTHYCENSLFPMLTQISKAPNDNARMPSVAEFSARMSWFATHALPANWRGPYFFGEQFSLLDLVFSTLFQTTGEIERAANILLPLPNEAMQRWADNVLARPSLRSAAEIREELEF